MRADEFFEARLREQERRALPGEWREEILENAMVDGALASSAAGRWREVFADLFPKPVLIPLGAAWMAIGFLWVTAPRDDGRARSISRENGVAEATRADGDAVLVVWLSQVRALEAGIAESEEAM